MTFDFGVAVPYLNLPRFLHGCIDSIVMQESSFTVHIHVQDGGTDDSAFEIVEEFKRSLDPGRILLTHAQEADSGPAQAVNRAISLLDANTVTWLGADDRLMPGAFQAVGTLLSEHPHVRWVTGVPFLTSELGIPLPAYGAARFFRFSTGYSREALRRGLHAGRKNHGFIQQEGTFWSKSLWQLVGGLDETLQLAFDFDLWCRLAEHADLIEMVAPLGSFRKRAGQASENMIGYHREVAQLRERYRNRLGSARSGFHKTKVAYFDVESERWKIAARAFLILDRGPLLPMPSMVWDVLRIGLGSRLRAR